MALQHSDLSVGDRVYAPAHAQVFWVERITPQYVLLKPEKNHHHENPRRLLEPMGGIHWGLESFERFKEISKLTDQLNAYPKSHWR